MKKSDNKKMMWAYLIHLADNMWADPGSTSIGAGYFEELQVDEAVWRQVIEFLPSQGINTVVVDVGDAIEYERHPEISIKGAWPKQKLRQELDHMREIGLTPIPKLNFSAGHDAWLGIYSRMLSTPIYYDVCKDVIEEVVEVFGYPEYFHLGMDEETPGVQAKMSMMCVRQNELLWHDMFFYFDVCEKLGCRPWIWSDICWNDKLRDTFLKRMPKSVLQSNWHYYPIFKREDGSYIDKEVDTYRILEEAGFDQVPTCSTIYGRDESAFWTMQEFKDKIAPERLKGYMTAPWACTRRGEQYRLMNDALKFGMAKEKVYPEVTIEK